jgi:hypothetical protein
LLSLGAWRIKVINFSLINEQQPFGETLGRLGSKKHRSAQPMLLLPRRG